MNHFIPLALLVIVGCGRGPVAESKPEFTSDAELIAWKDGPAEKFKGKVFRVRGTYNDVSPARDNRKSAKFRCYPGVSIEFVVVIPESIEAPNLTYGDDVIICFVSEAGELSKENKVTSLLRENAARE